MIWYVSDSGQAEWYPVNKDLFFAQQILQKQIINHILIHLRADWWFVVTSDHNWAHWATHLLLPIINYKRFEEMG